MDRHEFLKNKQFEAAMKIEEQGYEPDHIMVTYTPEEYASMHAVPHEKPYVLSEETINFFPISLIGSTAPLQEFDLSVDAFTNFNQKNIVEIYISAVRKTLAKAEEDEYTIEQIESELSIQKTLSETLKAAFEHYTCEYYTDLESYNNSANSMARTELGADLRATTAILKKIEETLETNERFAQFLKELLSQNLGTR